jgi:chromosome segregation ATPase
MSSLTFEKVVADCELLKGALEPLLGEMPHLNGENTELEAFLSEVKSLRRQQKELTGRLREVVRLRREAEARGQDLRSRVAAQLRGKLGFKSEQLLKFGVPPRRKPTRRKAEAKPEGPPTQPPVTLKVAKTPEAEKAEP